MAHHIEVTLGEVTFRHKGKIVRRESYIESQTLLESLHTVKDLATEAHTKRNIQILIDGIIELSPSK